MSDGIPRITKASSPASSWWMFGLLGGVLVLLSPVGESGREVLRFERAAVLRGELWRLVTGHLVHGSFRHLLINVFGLLATALLCARDYTAAGWALIVAASMAAIDLHLVLFEPQFEWYVGLSGVSHGMLAAGAVAWWKEKNRLYSLALGGILVAKIGWEHWRGALPFAGLPVVVDAHLYGAIGGALAALWIQVARPDWSFRLRSL